jgi:Matrixin
MRRMALVLLVMCVGALVAPTGPSAFPRPGGLIDIDLTLDELLDIAGVEAPDLGTGLLIHIDWPAEAPFEIDGVELTALTAAINPLGVVETRQAIRASDATGENASGECSDKAFKETGPSWPASEFPLTWRFRKASSPVSLDRDRILEDLRTAHGSWVRPLSPCDNRPEVDFAFKYTGKTTRGVKYDGYNVIEFGYPGGTALAVNYIWYQSGKILEADTRFNKGDYKWTTRKSVKNKYHIINVAAHELGHQVGLEDLGDPHGRLTMFGRTSKGERSKVSLGRGDMRGLAELSP